MPYQSQNDSKRPADIDLSAGDRFNAAERHLHMQQVEPIQAAILETYEIWLRSHLLNGRSLVDLMSALEKAGEPIKPDGFRKAFRQRFGGVRNFKQAALATPPRQEVSEVNLAFVHSAHGGQD